MIPLRDNIPTLRFPIVTAILIAANLLVFGWQLHFSSSDYSDPTYHRLGVSEQDQVTLEYGAIPYRLTHPGKDCAVGVTSPRATSADVVCQGTAEYSAARRLSAQGAPFAPLDSPPWWATVLTSMFMHAGILHIAFNMLFLWIFGNNVEDSMGRPRFVLFYLLAGIVSAYVQALLSSDATVPAIGASGAIAGVLGGYLLLYPRARVLTLIFIIFFVTLIEIPAAIMLGIWFVLQFVPAIGQVGTDAISGGGVAYWAHVGGFAFGLAAIKLFATHRTSVGAGHA
ncbi:MAG: rhomboid family intramembrane serine protease [Solirubrobacterales bacterium]